MGTLKNLYKLNRLKYYFNISLGEAFVVFRTALVRILWSHDLEENSKRIPISYQAEISDNGIFMIICTTNPWFYYIFILSPQCGAMLFIKEASLTIRYDSLNVPYTSQDVLKHIYNQIDLFHLKNLHTIIQSHHNVNCLSLQDCQHQ